MEAHGGLAVVKNEIKHHDERLKSLHKRVGEVQVENGGIKTDLAVLEDQVKEARGDISNLSKHVDRSFEKMQQQFDRKFENLIAAVRWGTGTMVALIGVLITILVKGG